MDVIEFSHLAGDHAYLSRASGLGNFNSVNASAILATNQRHALQVLATTTSSISLLAATCAMYWFIMMRRNFRRDLVLLLIAGGFWKSLWFVTFSAVTFTKGPVQTEDAFCQASGYSQQVGFEACDIAVFLMSMHMYFQIFPPRSSILSFLGHDGLYRVRHWVVATWVIFPNLSAGLAFINPQAAFMAQGAFCSIPLRPIWYRLFLFWLPRYLIWGFIVFVAVRIYRHVGSEFKVFGQEKDGNSSVDMPGESSIDRAAQPDWEGKEPSRRSRQSSTISKAQNELDEKWAPDDVRGASTIQPNASEPDPSARRESVPVFSKDPSAENGLAVPTSKSMPSSRRGSRQVAPDVISEDSASPPAEYFGVHRGSINSVMSRRSSGAHSDTIPPLTPIEEGGTGSNFSTSLVHNNQARTSANAAIRQRRRAIQRQLRLLFIYPVVYLMLWVIPFVSNILNYTDYYAQHPIFPLSVGQVFMLTIMTTVDVVVFCWRERPWRHIPGSDGTFLGSFMWWRYCFENAWKQGRRASRMPVADVEENGTAIEKVQRQTGVRRILRSSIHRSVSSPGEKRASSTISGQERSVMRDRRAFSGGSDRKHLEADRAHERLALERAENEQHRRSLQEARSSSINAQLPASPQRKDWFDREIAGELIAAQAHRPGKIDEAV